MANINKKTLDGSHVDELGTSTGPWPRYLVMTATDEGKTLSKLSPFAIHKGVKGIAGGDITIKRQFGGDIYLTCCKKSQSDNLLKCVLFGNVAPVVVTQHKSLNTSKGVVRNWELARTDPDEIKENVPSILDVHRIIIKRNNMEVKTNTLILTFNSPKIPDSLKICYLNIPVTQYVPNPLRCYKCQRFGHVTSKCKHNETCAKCSETGHKDESCTKAFKCINCGESHAAYSKQCAIFKREFDIQSIRVSRNISFFEARKVYQQTHGQKVVNYAGAVSVPTQTASVCTQTDVSWVGPEPVTRRQRPAASVTNRPVPSVSRSVGTTTRVADVKKTAAPARSSPAKKGEKSSKPSSPKQQSAPVPESDAYFTIKTNRGKVKENSPITNVRISPIKFKESMLKKERLKRSYQASDFLPDVEISPSRSDLIKNKVKKVDKNIMFSEIHKQRPRADDFFGDVPQCSNQTDVSLTSASDLETNVKSGGKVKKNIIRLPVD